MKRVMVTFRLAADTIKQLNRISLKTGIPKTTLIERAVRAQLSMDGPIKEVK